MELSDVRSLGERIVLKLRFGCDTAAHKHTTFVRTRRQIRFSGVKNDNKTLWPSLTGDLVDLLHRGAVVL